MSTDSSRAILLATLMLLLGMAPLLNADSTGKPNSSNGCGCHSSGSVTPTHDFPSSYTPSQTYSITIGMSGGPTGTSGGFSLTVDKGVLSNAGSNAQIVSGSATHSNSNSRSWTVDWTAPSSGNGTVSVGLAVNAVNGNGGDSGDQFATTTHSVTEIIPPNNAPVASNLALNPSNPGTLDDLVATYTYFDADGDSESGSEIRWTMGGVAQSSWDDLSTVPSSATSKGETWSYSVTPNDGEEFGTTVDLSSSVTVANTAPTVVNASIDPSEADESDTLSAIISYEDADDDVVSAQSIRWYLDGVVVPELDDSTTVSSLSIRSGDIWHFVVTPTDGEDAGIATNSSAVMIDSSNNAPTVENPLISVNGTIDTESELTAIWQFSDIDGQDEVSYEIEWLKSNIHVPQYDNQNPLPNSATTRGDEWNFRVRVSDGISWSDWASPMNTTLIDGNAAPVILSASISPEDLVTGGNLEISYEYFDADGDAISGLEIEWITDDSNINQMISENQFPLLSFWVYAGITWSAKVVAIDEFGAKSEEFLTDGALIRNSPPALNSLNITPVNATSLDDLNYSLDAFDLEGDLSVSRVIWHKEGSPVYVGEILPSEETMIGEQWSVEVQVSDPQGINSTFSSSAITIQNIIPSANISVFPEQAWAGVELALSGADSIDNDGSITAWYWDVNGTTYEGSEIIVGPFDGPVIATLTVIDDEQSQGTVSVTIAQNTAPTISDLSTSISGNEVTLTWNAVSQNNATYRVLRSYSIQTDVGSMELVAEVNSTSWTGTSSIAGEVYYAVTVVVDGQESLLISDSSSASIVVKAEQIDPESHPSHAGGGMILLTLILLSAAAVIALAFMERMSGGESS
jgi:hypothetical protein